MQKLDSVCIRLAKSSDYKSLMNLYGEFVNDPSRFNKYTDDSFYKVLNETNSFVYVAENVDEIIGFITFSIRPVVRYPKPIMEIDEIFVCNTWRRKSIGTILLAKAVEIAKNRECYYIFLASDKKRESAHIFHKTFGFDEYGFHFRMKI